MISNIDDLRQKISTVFRWEHGGKTVFITGSFNGWKTKIPMVLR